MANLFDLFKQISSTDSVKTAPVKYIVAGLGNPGKDYENTRHNAGFLAIDHVAASKGAKIDRAKFQALTAVVEIGGVGVLLMKPQTYMNNSGMAIREAANFYNVPADNIIVIFDDISIGVGKMRIRRKGSAGGHNGIKSIIEHLSTNEFPRIKLGVGEKPSPEYDLVSWVLGNIPEADRKSMAEAYSKAADALEEMISGNVDRAMNKYNN